MRCTFYRPEKVNLKEYENIIGKMNYDLEKFELTETKASDVYYYVRNLVYEAKPLDRNPQMCFWGMDNPENMPFDARVDYFYRPTYIATAFLMLAMLKYPELENGNEVEWKSGKELMEVLPKALRACTGRDFKGHGFDDMKGQLDTMELFLMARADVFIKKYPEMCPEFTELFNGILDFYREGLEKGKTKGGWDEDYSERMKHILSLVDCQL